jgi:drug/metabolite transporter (DMT)-like permease
MRKNSPAALPAAVAATMVGLCLSWGIGQVAIKVALVDVPPVTQSALRCGIASITVLAWCFASGRLPQVTRENLPAGLLVGSLFAVEFILLFTGIAHTNASRATVFLYSAPFFVALGGWFVLPEERLRPIQVGGLVLAFVGLGLAFGGDGDNGATMLGDLLVLGAAVGWAATTLVIKGTSLRHTTAETILLYQLVVAAFVTTGVAVAIGETSVTPSSLTLVSLAYQSLFVASFTYVVWFGLVRSHPANLLSAYTFLTPLFGVAAGWLLLGEPVTPGFLAAACLVVAGLVLVNRPGGRDVAPVDPD